MWQSVEILNTLTFKKLEYRFLVESTKIKSPLFPYKTAISEANVGLQCYNVIMLQIELWVQNGPITKNIVLPGLDFFETFVSVS